MAMKSILRQHLLRQYTILFAAFAFPPLTYSEFTEVPFAFTEPIMARKVWVNQLRIV